MIVLLLHSLLGWLVLSWIASAHNAQRYTRGFKKGMELIMTGDKVMQRHFYSCAHKTFDQTPFDTGVADSLRGHI